MLKMMVGGGDKTKMKKKGLTKHDRNKNTQQNN